MLLAVLGAAMLCSGMAVHTQKVDGQETKKWTERYTIRELSPCKTVHTADFFAGQESAVAAGVLAEGTQADPPVETPSASMEKTTKNDTKTTEEANAEEEIVTKEPDPTETESVSESTEKASKTRTVTITYYCACDICNGSYAWLEEDGIWYCSTASGRILSNNGENPYACAANFGQIGDRIEIDGEVYTILDRFGNNGGSSKVDIFCADGHARCNELGRRANVVVTLLD